MDNLGQGCWCLPLGDEKATVLKQAPEEYIDGEIAEQTAKKRRQQAQQSRCELLEDHPDNVIRLTSPSRALEAVAGVNWTWRKTSDEDVQSSDLRNLQSKKYRKKRNEKLKDVKRPKACDSG